MADEDFEFSCPACSGRLLGSPADVGQSMQCSYCSGTLTVPSPTPSQNNYQCTYVSGRSAHASGLWSLRNRRLILTIQSKSSVSPFGNSMLLRFDVTEVNNTTLHLRLKDGEQYWKHL